MLIKSTNREGVDILFIHAGPTVEERYGNKHFGDVGGLLPPLGLASIAAYLRFYGFNCRIIDAIAENMDATEIIRAISKIHPYTIGFTSLTPSFHKVSSIARSIKINFPAIPLILGGHHATVCKETALKDSPFDILVFGEGEETIRELMNVLRDYDYCYEKVCGDNGLQSIKGIAYLEDGHVKVNPPRELIPDVDVLPLPARDLIPMGRYIPLPNQYITPPVVHMVVQRGCPFSCSFCSNNAVFGRKVRKRSPALVVEEIKHVIKKYNARELSFWDDTITVDRKWLLEVCELILKENIKINWSCYASVSTVDTELLKTMRRAGCWNIFYGYESGVQELLDNIDKNITLEDIEYVNEITRKSGIEIRASFMLALPGETPELAMKTLEFAIKLNPEYAQFSLTTPFPGTKLFNEASKYGRLITDFSRYNCWEPVFIPYGYKDGKEILNVQKICNKRFYFRPAYIINRLKRTRTFEDMVRNYKGLKMAIGFAFSNPASS